MKFNLTSNTLLSVAVSLLSASFSNAELVDGLVENWTLDGDYSATVDPGHLGTLMTTGTGSAAFVPGKFGSAVDFTNSANNQSIVIIGGDENDFDFAESDFTISAWYTTESLYTNWQTIIAKGEGNGWRIARAADSATSLTFSGRKPHDYPAKLDEQDGSWHLLVSTVESGVETNMYIDGVLVATDDTGYVAENRSNPMQISGNPDAGNRGWNGNIDDVAVWNRALTQEEISSIWNNGDGASIASLTGGGSSAPFQVIDITHTRTVDNILVDLTFTSAEGSTYSVYASNDLSLPLASWNELNDGFPAAVEASTTLFSVDFNDQGLALDDHQFFVIVKN